MSSKKKATSSPEASMADQVAERIGKDILKRLAAQPLGLAAGGARGLLDAACNECRGFPDPVASAAARVFQLAGSKPPTDAEG